MKEYYYYLRLGYVVPKITFLQRALYLAPLTLATQAIAQPSSNIEEMLVVSERFTESLQQSPVSAHIVSGDHLEALNTPNLTELSNSIPNLIIGEGSINTNIHMRGTGSGGNRGFEQSVAMYVDEVYMGRGRQYRLSFVDLEQVEVFRGPQGVLFGKNAVAGAISLATRKAQAGQDFEFSLTGDYEPDYNDQAGSLILASGLGDSAGLRYVHKSRRADGFLTNTATNQVEPAYDEQLNRLSGIWEASDSWQLSGKYERSRDRIAGSSSQMRLMESLGPISDAFFATAFAFDPNLAPGNRELKSEDALGYQPKRNTDADNGYLALRHSPAYGDWLYTLGYSAYNTDDAQDGDFSPIPLVAIVEQHDFHQWSQELRFRSDFQDPINFQAGIYWQENSLNMQVYEDLAPPPIDSLNQLQYYLKQVDINAYPPTPLTRHMDFQGDNSLYSAFAEVEVDLNNQWQLLLGGRYISEEKDALRQSRLQAFQQPGVNASIAAQVSAAVYDVDIPMPDYQGSHQENHFTPSLKVLFSPNDQHNFYGKYEEGVKAGGFNANNDATIDDQQFSEELARSIELGWKASLLNDQLSVNTALFYTEIEDLQVTILNGTRFLTGNAAGAINQGIETDARWNLGAGFHATGYLAWLDAYYNDYPDGPCPTAEIIKGADSCNLTGKNTPFAPEWTAGVGINYQKSLTQELNLNADINIAYSDTYLLNFDADPIDSQPAYTRVDAQVGLDSQHWQLALIGRNLTDEAIYSYGLDAGTLVGAHAVFSQMPRTLAIRASIKF